MPRQFMLVCSHELQIYPPSITPSPPPLWVVFSLGGRGEISKFARLHNTLKLPRLQIIHFMLWQLALLPSLTSATIFWANAQNLSNFSFLFWGGGVTTVKSHKIRPRLPILAHTPICSIYQYRLDPSQKLRSFKNKTTKWVSINLYNTALTVHPPYAFRYKSYSIYTRNTWVTFHKSSPPSTMKHF